MADDLPPFTPGGNLYDLSTYVGRVRHFFRLIDPRTLFASADEIKGAQKLLQDFKEGAAPPHVTNADLWEAQKLVQSAVHPDTNEIIPAPFRMSAFVPANIPIVAGMVVAPPTLPNVVFWQFANQTFNAAFNFANRSISATDTDDGTSNILKAYASATVVSVTLAVGLGRLVNRVKVSPAVRSALQMAVPFTAVAGAGSCNVALMRYKDLFKGVAVYDREGVHRGTSLAAGKQAIAQVVATRIALPLPILLLPPYIFSLLKRVNALPGGKLPKLLVELIVMTVCIGGALPCAIALFPQTATIHRSQLEPSFAQLTDSKGALIEEFIYNKGI